MEQNEDRMPRNAEIWLGYNKLLMTDFPIVNLKWGEKINLMIKGDGGDPLEEKSIEVLAIFYKKANEEKKWLEENAWNSNEKILHEDKLFKRDWYLKNLLIFANFLTEDKNKLKLVTKECLQLIKYIGSKIEEVEVIKYEEKENKEEWEYKEFGANEYQTDLFFIRNSSRIKLIFNVMKKKI
jgi:hypothetical protein